MPLHTSFEIGGILSQRDCEDLARVLETSGSITLTNGGKDASYGDIIAALEFADVEQSSLLLHGSYPYATECRPLETFCREHGIQYKKTLQAAYDAEPGSISFFDGTDIVVVQTGLDGEPLVSLAQMQNARDIGIESAEGLIEHFNMNAHNVSRIHIVTSAREHLIAQRIQGTLS